MGRDIRAANAFIINLRYSAPAGQGADPSVALRARIEKLREAEPLLLNGYAKLNENAESIPEAARTLRLRQALERIVKLYESWDAAEPGQGYDAEAAEWRAKLRERDDKPEEPVP